MTDSTPTQSPIEEEVERDGADHDLVEGELLVEEVSIDGMCGVY